MARSVVWLQCLTYCILIGFTYSLIGDKVRTVAQGEFPYVVSISGRALNDHEYGNLHLCTGNLIKTKHILTVAHCLKNKNPNQIEIIAGSYNLMLGSRHFPESWITYDQWKINNTNHHLSSNNVAVITLLGDGIENIRPVNILTVSHSYLINEKIKILGWGILQNGQQPFHLRTAVLQVVSNEECSSMGTKLKSNNFSVPENYFCSKAEPYVVSSHGDGGGPILTRRNYLVGINIGACPKLEGNYHPDFLNKNLLNCHLQLHYYSDFLAHYVK